MIEKRPFVNEALEGKPITFKQLENLSKFLAIPLGYFFYDSAPNDIGLSAEFRTIKNKKKKNFSKNLKDLLLDMDYKKNWMSEYRKTNGYDKFKLTSYLTLDDDFNFNLYKIRRLLSIQVDWFRHLGDVNSTYDYLKKKIESFKVLVMESSVVGNNQKRTIDISDFRGFALKDEYSPLIFINNNDKTEARCFTLLHEFLHLLIIDSDDILIDLDNDIEKQINEYVAEILIPSSILKLKCEETNYIDYATIRKFAAFFKVSVQAMSVQLFKYHLIDFDLYNYILENINNYYKKGSGGNYYASLELKTSSTFSSAVYECVYSDQITFNEGYRLLGIKGNTFDTFGRRVYAKH